MISFDVNISTKKDNMIEQINNESYNENKDYKIITRNINVYYDNFHAIKNVSLSFPENTVTAFIGPSGCGKSTFLRILNRMNDYIDGFRLEGEVIIDNVNIYDKNVDVERLRKKVGMVFQKPNPFPKSIFENVAYGLRIQGYNNKSFLMERVEKALRQVGLWDEVKDNLKKNAYALSGGQQQRLCIARTLAVEPEIILMDEPTSALDPIAMAKIEQLIFELRNEYTIVIVTHNLQQAGRVSDYTAFFYLGELIEYGRTYDVFTNPKNKQTENYITGRFG